MTLGCNIHIGFAKDLKMWQVEVYRKENGIKLMNMDKNEFQCAKTLAPIILNKQCQKATKIEDDHLWLASAITIIAPFILMKTMCRNALSPKRMLRKFGRWLFSSLPSSASPSASQSPSSSPSSSSWSSSATRRLRHAPPLVVGEGLPSMVL